MKIEKIKPIPKYIKAQIKRLDDKAYKPQEGKARFYAYLTKNDGELVKVTVAAKNYRKKWYCKQVAVHGVHSDKCFVLDLAFYCVGGYVVDWYAEGIQKHPKLWDYENCWGEGYDVGFDPYAPVVNKEYALKFPEYKYSAADGYKYADILKYLRIYEQFPQAELLVKFGLSAYATSKQILRKTAKDRQFRKWLINSREEIARSEYFIRTILLAYKMRKPLAWTQEFEKFRLKLIADKNINAFRIVFNNDLERVFNYLKKSRIQLGLYYDYLNACNYIGLDMTQDKNLFPHDFQRWHDIRIDEYNTAKAVKDAETRKELYDKFAKIAEKYLSLQRQRKEDFIVLIAKSPADLIQEGNSLHHCVGKMNYDQRFVREQSLIFFLRNVAEPQTPYVTIEYSLQSHKVLQCYGDMNCKPDKKTLDFINNKWLPYANRKLKQIAA